MLQMARFFAFITILSGFGLFQTPASGALLGSLYKDSTISFGNPAPQKALRADGLRLFVWNIHKASNPQWIADFFDLSQKVDLALFQEAVSTKSVTSSLSQANPDLSWTLAKSFQQWDFSFTGVATGAKAQARREEVVFSDVKEPITETPKTLLVSEFNIENSQETLLVANVHGINFVGLESYKVQITQLVKAIRTHDGPLIVAGDFNTWDPERMIYLRRVLSSLGLTQLNTPIAGLLDLDHIFIRGLNVEFIFDLSNIDSSDHAPLMVDLTYETNKVMVYGNK